ncbi:hypothetical protein ABEB36_006634 [Hypothenemus hampei]
MQIIAHNTEYMKYVIKPPQSTIPTTTTIRPTPSHKPAVFAPVKPLGPEKYFSKDNTQAHYVEVQQQSSGPNYFDRYNPFLPQEQGRQFDQSVYNEVDTFVGKYFGNIFRLANEMDPENESFPDDETQVLGFSKNFEDSDSNYKYEILRQKKVPPTKAYVTLLSLYDLLNKEAKRMMLNKFVVSFATYSLFYYHYCCLYFYRDILKRSSTIWCSTLHLRPAISYDASLI